MSLEFNKYIAACIESTRDEFNELLQLYDKVDSFKEKVLLKYFLYMKQEEKTLKLFQTFSIPIQVEYLQYAHKHNMKQLLFFFSQKEPVLFFSLFPQSSVNFFKQYYFELLL